MIFELNKRVFILKRALDAQRRQMRVLVVSVLNALKSTVCLVKKTFFEVENNCMVVSEVVLIKTV